MAWLHSVNLKYLLFGVGEYVTTYMVPCVCMRACMWCVCMYVGVYVCVCACVCTRVCARVCVLFRTLLQRSYRHLFAVESFSG